MRRLIIACLLCLIAGIPTAVTAQDAPPPAEAAEAAENPAGPEPEVAPAVEPIEAPEAGKKEAAKPAAPGEAGKEPKAGPEDPRAEARDRVARETADDQKMVAGKAAAELVELLGHARFRVRQMAEKRLAVLITEDPENVVTLCYEAFLRHADPEVRMRARALLVDYVALSGGSAPRGFVGIGLVLHGFFDKAGNLKFAVKVSQVIANTPAEKAGMKAEDMITAVDGIALDGQDADQKFMDLVGGKGAGKKINLSLLRGEQVLEMELTLAARPENLEDNTPPIDREQLFRNWLDERQQARP